MNIYKIIELSQKQDGHGYFHYINYNVVAVCESKLAAEQHIDLMLQQWYEKELATYEKNRDYYGKNPDYYDVKPELKNSILLSSGFPGNEEDDYEEYERFIIEESPLILEN